MNTVEIASFELEVTLNICIFSWNGDLNFNIRDVEFSLYSFNLFKVTSISNDAISTSFIAVSNSYEEISTWIV